MKVLIDTHVLIWWVQFAARIPDSTRDLLLDPRTEVNVSSASAWEIATKMRQGRLIFDSGFMDDFDASVASLSFMPLPVNALHAVTGARIDATHKDPFDRVLAGQALVENAAVVTTDAAFKTLGVKIVW